jgi:hypothetical protein
MAAAKLVPRALIYSFQNDAAKELLQSKSSSEMSDKVVARLLKAIDLNGENPLFIKVEERPAETQQVGRWWTLWPMENHLRIKGYVSADCKRVGIFVNDRLVKLVNSVPRADDPNDRRVFRFNMRPDLLSRLPRKTVIGVGSEVGYLRHRDGGLTFRDERLSGDATLFKLLAENHFLTKKGRIQRRLDHDENWKVTALSAYTKFRDYFETTFGYKPFIICGTLLGYHRDADFIAHDDDMDVAYFSKCKSPRDIKKELRTIVFRMLRDGYDIKLARKSGFFKPSIGSFSFDVFPMWSDRDCLWMMNTTRQRAGPELILPVQTARFRGVKVYVPNNIERYIESEYGPNWRVPDPGYRAVGEPGTPEYLSQSCLGKDDIRALYEEVKQLSAERQDVGRLSIAELDIDALAEE